MRSPSFRPSHNKRTGFFGTKPFTRTAIDSMGRACFLGSSSSKRALPINSTAHRVRMTGPVCSARDRLKTLKERGRFPTRIIRRTLVMIAGLICHPLRTARLCTETKISNCVLLHMVIDILGVLHFAACLLEQMGFIPVYSRTHRVNVPFPVPLILDRLSSKRTRRTHRADRSSRNSGFRTYPNFAP